MHNTLRTLLLGLVATSAAGHTHAAEPQHLLQSMITCQDSWLDWKDDPVRAERFIETLDRHFYREERRRVLIPREPVQLMGHAVIEVTPQNAGIGLGFAVTVKAPLDKVRQSYETAIDATMSRCGQHDALTLCTKPIAERKTAMLASPTARPEIGTVMGCFYFYQK